MSIVIQHLNTAGMDEAIHGMRNPMGSWRLSDSEHKYESPHDMSGGYLEIGPEDEKLMKRLINGGSEQSKFRRMIVTWLEIDAPVYWWKDFDTYKVGTVANSESTRHRIVERPFELSDFSHDRLMTDDKRLLVWGQWIPMELLEATIKYLNDLRGMYLNETDPEKKNDIWLSIVQLIPGSFMQERTVMLNYEVLANIYRQRRNHRLEEWQGFCRVCKHTLPYSWIFTYDVDRE